jgi:hypothetical protein
MLCCSKDTTTKADQHHTAQDHSLWQADSWALLDPQTARQQTAQAK